MEAVPRRLLNTLGCRDSLVRPRPITLGCGLGHLGGFSCMAAALLACSAALFARVAASMAALAADSASAAAASAADAAATASDATETAVLAAAVSRSAARQSPSSSAAESCFLSAPFLATTAFRSPRHSPPTYRFDPCNRDFGAGMAINTAARFRGKARTPRGHRLATASHASSLAHSCLTGNDDPLQWVQIGPKTAKATPMSKSGASRRSMAVGRRPVRCRSMGARHVPVRRRFVDP